jgi:thiosulfate/3-mercaptopyruvate sulfurtransferase
METEHTRPGPAVPGAATPGDGLISCAQLRDQLGSPGLVILDCRHDLARPDWGRAQYGLGHIPGALFAHLDEDLAGARTGRNGRHPLPDAQALAARLRAWGVGPDSRVVAYDATEGAYAARAWWLLRWLGHARVAVLDGGWSAWMAAAMPVDTRVPAPPAGQFRVGASLQAVADAAAVLDHARAATAAARTPTLLLDARAPDRYEGRNETLDPVAGHIPGAVNRCWKDNLDAQGRFKPAAQLRAEYSALLDGRPPHQAIVQCGSGVTACHDALALHLAGLPGAALYPGSWSEWIADPARPVVRGAGIGT